MQGHTRIIELLVSLRFRAALASHKRVHARLGRAMASGQRGNSKVRAPDTRPEPGSSARTGQCPTSDDKIVPLGQLKSRQNNSLTGFVPLFRCLG